MCAESTRCTLQMLQWPISSVILTNRVLRHKKGNEYNKNSIRRILTNRKYIGIAHYHGQDYRGIVPAIIDDELFEQVQIMMQKNKKAPARAKATDEQYILTTKLYCGECRAPMTGISGYSHTGVPYQYYSCVNARKKGNVCHKSNVRKDLIENAVVKVIRSTMNDTTIADIAKEIVAQDKKSNSSSNLAALQKKIKRSEKSAGKLASCHRARTSYRGAHRAACQAPSRGTAD